MTPEERRDFREKSLRLARGMQMLATKVKQTPFSPSVERPSTTSPESTETETPFSVTVKITRGAKPLEEHAKVEFQMGFNKFFKKKEFQKIGPGQWKLTIHSTDNDLGVRVNDKEVFSRKITKSEGLEIKL